MFAITSPDNEKIKYLNGLNDKKRRLESREFFVENLKTISDALDSGFKPRAVFVTEALVDSADPRIAKIMAGAAEIFIINERINKKFSNLDTPSGIAAVFGVVVSNIDLDAKIIYLNAINDPGNLGTILRTILALGFENVVVDEHCADIYNYKTINASKDAIFKLNIAIDSDRKIFKEIKSAMKVYSTNLEGGQDPDIVSGDRFCLVFGAEAAGVDKEILDQSDAHVRLKMSGRIESLNVAIACGIMLYQVNSKFLK